MTTSLRWVPVINREGEHLDDDLKHVLYKKYSLSSGHHELGYPDLNYLEGLKDAGVKSASDLIEAIKEHEFVAIFLI